jgi:hypothetical protein
MKFLETLNTPERKPAVKDIMKTKSQIRITVACKFLKQEAISKNLLKIACNLSSNKLTNRTPSTNGLLKNVRQAVGATNGPTTSHSKQPFIRSIMSRAFSKEKALPEGKPKRFYNDIGSLETESSERRNLEPLSIDNMLSDDGNQEVNTRLGKLLPTIKLSKSMARMKPCSDPFLSLDKLDSKDTTPMMFGKHRTPIIDARKETRFMIRDKKASLPKNEFKQQPPASFRLNPQH